MIDNGKDLCTEGLTCAGGHCVTDEEAAQYAATHPPEPRPDAGAASKPTDDDEDDGRADGRTFQTGCSYAGAGGGLGVVAAGALLVFASALARARRRR